MNMSNSLRENVCTDETKVDYTNKNNIYCRQGIDRFYVILFTN